VFWIHIVTRGRGGVATGVFVPRKLATRYWKVVSIKPLGKRDSDPKSLSLHADMPAGIFICATARTINQNFEEAELVRCASGCKGHHEIKMRDKEIALRLIKLNRATLIALTNGVVSPCKNPP
jgi:hypothetical protein